MRAAPMKRTHVLIRPVRRCRCARQAVDKKTKHVVALKKIFDAFQVPGTLMMRLWGSVRACRRPMRRLQSYSRLGFARVALL